MFVCEVASVNARSAATSMSTSVSECEWICTALIISLMHIIEYKITLKDC